MPFKGLLCNLSRLNPKFFEAKRGLSIYLLEPNAVIPQQLKDRGESRRNVVGRGNAFRLRGFKSRIQPHEFRVANIQTPQHPLTAVRVDLFGRVSHENLRFCRGSLQSGPKRYAPTYEGACVCVLGGRAYAPGVRVCEVQDFFQESGCGLDAFLKCEIGIRFTENSETVTQSPIIMGVSRQVLHGCPNPLRLLALNIAIGVK